MKEPINGAGDVMLESGFKIPAALLPLWRALYFRQTRLGLCMTMLILIVALTGPSITPHSPNEFVGGAFMAPARSALLGTDYLGRDVLSRLLYGGWSVVWMSVSATTIGVGIGMTIGLVAGYSQNWFDNVAMRTLDIVLAFPQIVLVLLFVSLIGAETWLIVLLVGVAWVPGIARVTRGVTLDIVTKEFVSAAEVLGVSRFRILFGEVLPNISTPLMVEYGLRLTWSIGLVAGLSFLGFGIQPPNADWGLMINENRNGLVIQPWAVIAPVCCIAVFTIGTNLLAEGISRTLAGIDRRGGK